MNAPTLPIAVLVGHLRQAKKAEDEAREYRLGIEAQITSRFAVPPGGEGTVKDDEISISYKVSRKIDTEALKKDFDLLTANQHKAIRWKAELDTKHFKALQDFDAPAYQELCKYITTSPLKPAITLKD